MEVAAQDQGVPAGWEVVSAAPPPPAAPSSGALAETRMPAGVPARGRGTQFNPEKAQRGVDLATTPLAHPTGIDAIDGFTSPVGLVSLAAGGAGIARAGLTEGVAAAAKAAASEASPVIKYEVARRTMHAIGIPDAIASPVAMVIAGYKRGAKEAPASQGAVSEPGYPRGSVAAAPAEAIASPASPAGSSPVAPAPPAVAATRTTAASPSAESVVPRPQNSLPDQRALNDEALARHRAEYRARQSAPPEPPLTKAKLVGPEQKEYTRLVTTDGKTHAQAMDLIQAQRDFQARFGLSAPTAEDARFPKGMRGKPPIRP